MLVDTHCHLQFSAYKNDADVVYKKCADKGMLLNIVGSQYDTSLRAIEYAEKYSNAYATVGLHPIHLVSAEVDEEEVQFKSREEKFDYDAYKKLAEQSKVIAIGECGLELHHLPEGKSEEEAIAVQTEAFIGQYKLAQELDLPMVIHVRNAHRQMIDLLRVIANRQLAVKQSPDNSENREIATSSAGRRTPRNDKKMRGVIHCYTANWEYAKEYLDLGFYLGFTGVITFPAKKTDPKTQEDLLAVVKNCPLDRILIETDAPYLAPQAYRGERCEPWMVEEAAKKVAEIRGLTAEEVIKQTTNNALGLFTGIHV
ncbi:MAG: TatD family hydrolase [Patescibacteria group bacterium]|nr:TatD family hydrolase [Patescibacteria group bacterium]